MSPSTEALESFLAAEAAYAAIPTWLKLCAASIILLTTHLTAYLLLSLIYHLERITHQRSALLTRLELNFFACLCSVSAAVLFYANIKREEEIVKGVVVWVGVDLLVGWVGLGVLWACRKFWKKGLDETGKGEVGTGEGKGEVLWRRVFGVERVVDHEKGV